MVGQIITCLHNVIPYNIDMYYPNTLLTILVCDITKWPAVFYRHRRL